MNESPYSIAWHFAPARDVSKVLRIFNHAPLNKRRHAPTRRKQYSACVQRDEVVAHCERGQTRPRRFRGEQREGGERQQVTPEVAVIRGRGMQDGERGAAGGGGVRDGEGGQ